MNINVEAVYIVSALIFVTSMGGLGAAWLLMRHDDKVLRESMERRRADRG